MLLRDGFSYVLRVGAGQPRSAQTKVTVGRRVGDRIEITGGLDADARVVASGRRLPGRRRPGARRRRGMPPAVPKARHEAPCNVSSWSIRNPIPSVLLFVLLTLRGPDGLSAR